MKIRLTDKQRESMAAVINSMVDNCVTAWEKPWSLLSVAVPCQNFITRNKYALCNEFMLQMICDHHGYKVPYFLTYDAVLSNDSFPSGLAKRAPYVSGQGEPLILRHARNEDSSDKVDNETGMVIEHAHVVIQQYTQYYKFDEDGKTVDWKQKPLTWKQWTELSEDEQDKYQPIKRRQGAWEYNIEQTDFPYLYPDAWKQMVTAVEMLRNSKEQTECVDVRNENLDKVLSVPGGWRCPISNDGVGSSYYIPSKDSIHLPKPEAFIRRSKYYSTALHEMAHSTKVVFNRKGGINGDKNYAREELVAELTAAIVSMKYSIEVTHDAISPYDQEHLAYIKGWRQGCENPKEVIGEILDDVMDAVQYEMNYIDYVDQRIEAYNKKTAKAA